MRKWVKKTRQWMGAAFPTFKKKLTLAFIFTAMVPLALTFVVVVGVSVRDGREKALEALSSNTIQVQNNTESRILQINKASSTILSYLTAELYGESGASAKTYLALTDFVKMRDTIKNIEINFDVFSVRVYSDRLPFVEGDSINFFSMSELEKLPVGMDTLTQRMGSNSVRAFIDPAPKATAPHKKFISFYRPVKNIHGGLEAVYLIDVDASSFLKGVEDYGSIAAGIVDGEGRVIHASSAEAEAMLTLENIPPSNTGYYRVNDTVCMARAIDGVNWRLVMLVPQSEVYRMSYALVPIYITFFVLSILLCVLAGVWMSNLLSKRIFSFYNAVQHRRFDSADSLTDIDRQLDLIAQETQRGDEIDQLVLAFRGLLKNNAELIGGMAQRDIEIERNKFTILQAQINPHFLYNALDTIRSSLIMGEDDKAKRSVEALSRFYRVSLSKGRDIITLEEELEMLESYLAIESVGYDGRISWEIRAGAEDTGAQIPKFTLQPIVENAIIHGKEAQGKARIHIDLRVEGDGEDILVLVQDDGVGVAQDKLESIRQSLARQDPAHEQKGFGLYNINNRLRLLYGKGYGLWVETNSTGTLVRVRVPREYCEAGE